MPEEVKEVEVAKKKRGRKLKYDIEPEKITGDINADQFTLAIDEIQKDSLVSSSDVTSILVESMEQAYLEWSYPGLFKDRDNPDPAKALIQCRVDFATDSKGKAKFTICDIKTVTPEDDIVDDAYQISVEDAQEYKEGAEVGDVVYIPFDVTTLTKAYVRRVKQLFQSHLKDKSKQAILTVYQDRIGELIEGEIVKEENTDIYEVNFGKAVGYLKRNNSIPGDKFAPKERVTVLLKDVSDRSNPPSLIVSRSDEKFIVKLMERSVPELASGEIIIKKVTREAGRRTKIFVESKDKNIDPVGTCIGPDSNRIRGVLSEIHGEKIDVLKYEDNKALQVVEAMKPAVIIGLNCPEDFFDENVHYDELERERDYEFPKVTAVVINGTQGVAIGSGGVNVKLASRLTACTISVLQVEDAIRKNVKYIPTSEIIDMARSWKERQNALEGIVPEQSVAEEEFVPEETVVEEAPAVETTYVETTPVVQDTTVVNEPAHEAEPVVEPEAVKSSTTTEMKAKPVEHVEIRNKPRISLEELEEALATKKGPKETRSYRRKYDHKDKEEKEEQPSIASTATAMPIYTDEELKAMEEEDNDYDGDYEGYDDDDLDQYDYYDEDDKGRN